MKPSNPDYSNAMQCKHRRFIHMLSVSLVLCCWLNISTALAQYTDIKRLGTTQAICKKPGVQTREALQAFFADNPSLITDILEDAQWQGNAQNLFDAIAAGEFTENEYQPGIKFEWMGMRSKGQPKAFPLRQWAGEESFRGYGINIVDGCQNYQFVIPKICCNVALADISIVADQPSLFVVTEDTSMSVCTDQGARVTLTGPEGVSRDLMLDQNQCWNGGDMEQGDYTISAIAECGRSDRMATIVGPQVETKEFDEFKLIPFIAAIAGTETVMRLETAWDMDMRDSSGIFGVRAGLKLPLNEKLFIVPSLGVLHRNGVNEGNVYPDDSVNLDLGIEQFVTDRFFVGAGIGAWNVDDSDFREGSVFLKVGGSITRSSEWFAEARGIDSDNTDGNDGFSDNRSFSAGFRWLFN